MIASANGSMLAAVGVLTVVAAGSWAGALGPGVCALLAASGGGLLAATGVARTQRRFRTGLRRALRRRDEHLARTAHELRTPLTAILSSLEIVRQGHASTPAEVDSFLEIADLAARHLTFLVNDVLDHAAIDAGTLRLELATHAVGDLLRDGQRAFGMHAARHEVLVHADAATETLQVHADARRVLQVLFNLIGNAIKFSPPGRGVHLHVEPDGDRVRFRVVDEGPGVPVELRPQLFHPFVGDDRHGRADCTGLGLHIARRIVEQMGGAIGYLPRTPRGSEFWFTLPITGRPAPVAGAPLAAQ